MPVPTNCVPEDAITIPSIPYQATITDVFLSPQDTNYPTSCDTDGFHPLWWKYTPPVGVNYIAFSATGDGVSYFPQLSIFTGTPPSLTQYVLNAEQFFCGARGLDFWWSVPLTAGSTYYIRFTDFDGTAPEDAELLVTFALQPFITAPAGSIVVPDDGPGFPAVVLSVLQDGELFQTPELPIGEFAASLPDGSICGSKGQGALAENALLFFDSEWNQIAEVALPESPEAINSNETDYFVITDGTIYQFDAAGTELESWNPPAIASAGEAVIGNRDATIAYYVNSTSSGTAIRAWDLVNDLALSNLTTIPAGRFWEGPGDGGTLEDDTIWFAFRANSGGNAWITGYNAAGAQQFDYLVVSGTDRLNHAVYYPGTGTPEDPESVWLWIYKAGVSTTDIFRRIDVSDGSVVQEFEVPGTGLSGEPAQADVQFAVSNSCPLIVLRHELVPTPPEGEGGSPILGFETELPIRVVIRTGVMS